MTAPYHLRLVTAFDFPPPCDIEPIDTLSDPIVGENLDAARSLITWVPISLVAWIVIIGLIWVLR